MEGHPEIYAIGDSAELLGPAWGAKQGHIAEITVLPTLTGLESEGNRLSHFQQLSFREVLA